MYFRVLLDFRSNLEQLRCVTSHYFIHVSYIFCVLIDLVTQWKFYWDFTSKNLKKKSRLMKIWCWTMQKYSQPSLLDCVQFCIDEKCKPGALCKHWLLCAAGQFSLLAHPLEATNSLWILEKKSLCLHCEHREVHCSALHCQYLHKSQSLP